jgi:pSer/pThr/pTyr-binding forkhead associated (FHA) protein
VLEGVDIVVRGSDGADQRVKLPLGVAQIGRAPDCEVVLDDISVSRRHARVVVRSDGVRVEDLGSGNGIMFRGYRVSNHAVEHGDELVIGAFALSFRLRGSPRALGGDPTAVPGVPVMARLEVVAGSGMSRRVFMASSDGLTIGRSDARDVVLSDPASSRHHATLAFVDGGWRIRDEQSANGVFVHGARVREALLREGDRIRIGSTEFRFMTGDPSATDSNTQLALPMELEASEAVLELAPDAETPPPAPPRRPPPPRRTGRLLRMLVTSFGILLTMSTLAAGGIWFALARGDVPMVALSRGSVVELSLEQQAAVGEWLTRGGRSLRNGDGRGAWVAAEQALQMDPGRSASKRLAYAAAEHLVLESLSSTFPVGGPARPHSPAGGAEACVRLSEALQWSKAIEACAAAVTAPVAPVEQADILSALERAQREVAREVEAEWRESHRLLRHGRRSDAARRFDHVLAIDPHHAAARLWLRHVSMPVSEEKP